jgi:hypothetical protein
MRIGICHHGRRSAQVSTAPTAGGRASSAINRALGVANHLRFAGISLSSHRDIGCGGGIDTISRRAHWRNWICDGFIRRTGTARGRPGERADVGRRWKPFHCRPERGRDHLGGVISLSARKAR